MVHWDFLRLAELKAPGIVNGFNDLIAGSCTFYADWDIASPFKTISEFSLVSTFPTLRSSVLPSSDCSFNLKIGYPMTISYWLIISWSFVMITFILPVVFATKSNSWFPPALSASVTTTLSVITSFFGVLFLLFLLIIT